MKSYLPNEKDKVRTLDQINDFPCLARIPNSDIIFLVSEKEYLDHRYLQCIIIHEDSKYSYKFGNIITDLAPQELEIYCGKLILEN